MSRRVTTLFLSVALLMFSVPVGASLLTSDYNFDAPVYAIINFTSPDIDLSLIEMGVTTERIYVGNELLGTRTISVTPASVDSHDAVPFWWCCSWPIFATIVDMFNGCSGLSMATCTFFRRTISEVCLNCTTIFSSSFTTLPGVVMCFMVNWDGVIH